MASAFMSKHAERHAAEGVTGAKRRVLLELAVNWQRARSQYIHQYWDVQYVSRVVRSPRQLREEQRKLGWAPVAMSVAHHQTAFLSAMDALRRTWLSRLALIAREIGRDSHRSGDEKRWGQWVLRHPDLLQMCLDGATPEVPLALTCDAGRASRRLRQSVIRRRGRPPRPARRPWFEIDAALYRTFSRREDRYFRGSWMALGVGRGRRLCLPLAGRAALFDGLTRDQCGSNVRVVVGDRIAIPFRIRVPVASALDGQVIGIDKGYRTPLTVSDGDPGSARAYGRGASLAIARIADTEAARLRDRRRIAAHERSIRSTNAAKARRIRRRNLPHFAVTRRSARGRAFLRSEIGRALNELFRRETPLLRICVERLDLRSTTLSRRMHQRLGRWAWGYLQERLAYKAELNGVELNVVNAAYTSLTCPRCGFASKKNRRGDTFECSDCGCTGSSDAVAATNVLARGSDPAITRFMPATAVKRILDERWRSARSGRAWGSNAGNAVEVGRSSAEGTGDSREQPPLQVAAVHQRSANPARPRSPRRRGMRSH